MSNEWKEHIKNYPKLEEYWNMIPEPGNILFSQQIDSFARSQAIEFAEWCIIEGFYYYPSLKAWMEDPSDLNKYSSSEIYDLFLAEQAEQKEGGII